MPASLRIKPLDRTLLFAPGGALDPMTAAKQVADYARTEIAAAQAIDDEALGHPTPHTDFVNGAPSQVYEDVKPGQSIVALFDLNADLLQWIYDTLVAHAPVLTGEFRKSIAIYADGTQVDDPVAAAGAAEIVFTSLVPYARKIERGESKQAPDGVFQGVAAMAAARYGNQAAIKFTYQEPTGGANGLEDWAQHHSGRTAGAAARRRQYSRDVRQPAIVVTFR